MNLVGTTAATVVPRPRRWSESAGSAVLSDGLVIEAGAPCEGLGRLLARELSAPTGWSVGAVEPGTAPGANKVSIGLSPALGPEEYRLTVSTAGVSVLGGSAAGAFYGTRTLLQLLPAELGRRAPLGQVGQVGLPATEVEDGPRFSWRGVGLDVARHFMPKRFLFELVDLAALHKLNVLHLHLTDDQGWRFQVDGYPMLTAVGAWRRESPVGHYRDGVSDGRPHGGFYTKADLSELVSYAAERHVTVLPEVDMPGHMQAAIAAYPELGNLTSPLEVFTSWGISDHVLNMEEPTLRFCADVLDELMDLFPSQYVHIGGDECPTTEWSSSPAARQRATDLGLDGPEQLQGWFTARMAEVLAQRGRSLAAWDEVMDAGAPPGSLIVVWRAEHARRIALAAARHGHDVVMAPQTSCYFDWAYEDSPDEPVAIQPALSVETVYGFEPVPEGLEEEHHSRVRGAQCQLWTEYVGTPEHAEYMYFPRLCAFSEAVWSDGSRDWPAFEERLGQHVARLDARGTNYRPLSGPTPGQARVWHQPATPGRLPGTD
jgi:hexosaminidase